MKLYRSGRGLFALFAITIILPGALLVWFGVRGLLQERRLAEQEVQERSAVAADELARNLEFELSRWQRWIDAIPAEGGLLSEAQKGDLQQIGHSVVVWPGGSAWPTDGLLYTIVDVDSSPLSPLPQQMMDAEALELRGEELEKASSLYLSQLETSDSRLRPVLLHRVARTLRKMNQPERAVAYYEELLDFPDTTVGGVPADLVARFELMTVLEQTGRQADAARAGLELYRLLVDGHWRLEKSRYLYYAEESRSSASVEETLSSALVALRSVEEEKLALTEAAWTSMGEQRRALEEPNGVHLTFRGSSAPESPVLIIGPGAGFVDEILEESLRRPFGVRIAAPGGLVLYDSGSSDEAARAADRSVADGDFAWQLRVWPADTTSLYQDIGRRRNLYLALVALVISLMAFGGYFTARMVRREMEVVRLKSDFVSAVSHEFRSPLTGIRQLAEMLERGRVRDDEKRQHYYGLIRRESDRLSRLVENVLDFSRMEEGKREYRFEPIETTSWLRKLAEGFDDEAGGKQARLEASVKVNLPVINGDQEALSTAVLNLLDNAVKYSPSPATVWLDASSEGRELTIRVHDRGVGIPVKDQPYVFEKFYRSTSNGSQGTKGTGLGLSLVKHIVTAHGGRVDFESRPEEGSTFSIHLKTLA